MCIRSFFLGVSFLNYKFVWQKKKNNNKYYNTGLDRNGQYSELEYHPF